MTHLRTKITLAAASALLIPSSTALAVPAAVGTTTVTLEVARCEGCQVSVYNTVLDRTGETLATVTINDGRAHFRIQTRLTHGMSMNFDGDAAGYITPDYRPDIAMAVVGETPGRTVSARQARSAKGGWDCWSGTTRRSVTIRLNLFVFKTKDFMNNDKVVNSVAMWASPTLRPYGKPRLTDKQYQLTQPGLAQMGDQDLPYCY